MLNPAFCFSRGVKQSQGYVAPSSGTNWGRSSRTNFVRCGPKVYSKLSLIYNLISFEIHLVGDKKVHCAGSRDLFHPPEVYRYITRVFASTSSELRQRRVCIPRGCPASPPNRFKVKCSNNHFSIFQLPELNTKPLCNTDGWPSNMLISFIRTPFQATPHDTRALNNAHTQKGNLCSELIQLADSICFQPQQFFMAD